MATDDENASTDTSSTSSYTPYEGLDSYSFKLLVNHVIGFTQLSQDACSDLKRKSRKVFKIRKHFLKDALIKNIIKPLIKASNVRQRGFSFQTWEDICKILESIINTNINSQFTVYLPGETKKVAVVQFLTFYLSTHVLASYNQVQHFYIKSF